MRPLGAAKSTLALHHYHAERNGKVLDQNAVNVFRVTDGKVIEVRGYSDDGGAEADFWA
jgi:ketosteroid isomerase-like protein